MLRHGVGDVIRLLGAKQCARCDALLQSDELVMRAREFFFHTRCFACDACGIQLTKGSTFGMAGNVIFCKDHYEQLQHPPPAR